MPWLPAAKASDVVQAKLLHGAGLGVDPCNRGVVARQTVGDPQIAVEIGLGIVRADHAVVSSEGVPSDQSLPSFEAVSAPSSLGKSYSLNTARAASPDGRGSSLIFIELSPGPARARQIGRQFLLVEFDVRCAFVIRARGNSRAR